MLSEGGNTCGLIVRGGGLFGEAMGLCRSGREPSACGPLSLTVTVAG
jgi:hypothetical protein